MTTSQAPGASVLVRAAWVCPVATPPLRDGWVHVVDGRVAAVGDGRDAPPSAHTLDLGPVAVLPGLVNAHTHLELSWLRGRVPPSADFLSWVGQLMAARRSFERADDPTVMAPIEAAIAEMRDSGTVAVGDIANALVTPALLAAAGMPAVVFHELMGFRRRRWRDGRGRGGGQAWRAEFSAGCGWCRRRMRRFRFPKRCSSPFAMPCGRRCVR